MKRVELNFEILFWQDKNTKYLLKINFENVVSKQNTALEFPP